MSTTELQEFLRGNVVPEIRRQLGHDGDVRGVAGPSADSPAVCSLELAFYPTATVGSRIEIPFQITPIPCFDRPTVRTVAGTVFLTTSDADMIESKVVAIICRRFVQARDILDLFLFQSTLKGDSDTRVLEKFRGLSLSAKDVRDRLGHLDDMSSVHIREVDQIIASQVEPSVGSNLLTAGGAPMIWEAVMDVILNRLRLQDYHP
ncbi:MAG: hypothetical protein R3E01_19915 [Pirellulaceae bacterium]|nr:hypothetical protein [Planctomycetales bacterium]